MEQKIINSQEQNLPENTADKSKSNSGIQGDNTVKDPDQWTTGNEPMTGAQKSYLKTLSDEAGEDHKEDLTKAEASKKIEELQHKTGRGLNKDKRINDNIDTEEPE